MSEGQKIVRFDYFVPEDNLWYNYVQVAQLDDNHHQYDILAFIPLRSEDEINDPPFVKASEYEAEAIGDLLRHALDAYLRTPEGAWEWDQFCKTRDKTMNSPTVKKPE